MRRAEALSVKNDGGKNGQESDDGGESDARAARLPRVRSSRPALSSMTTKVKRTMTAPA